MLSRAPYDSCVLPAVRSFTIICCIEWRPHREKSAIDPAMASANTTAFSQRLLQIAPRARKLAVSKCDSRGWPPHIVHDFRLLVSELLPAVDQFEYDVNDLDHRIIPTFDGVCNLVHINYTLDFGSNSFCQLARQCARSLRSLSLRQVWCSSEPMDISRLIQYPGGGYVEYPSLQKLKLEMQNHPASAQRPTFA
ncbi:hypothetical protein GGF44_006620, partial [Coemansia sp. RSA 1694]